MIFRNRPVFFCLLWLIAAAFPLHAQVNVTVTPGFGGAIVEGKMNPVTVTIVNDGAEIRGFAEIEVENTIWSKPFVIPARATSRHRLLFRPMPAEIDEGVTVRFTNETGGRLFSAHAGTTSAYGSILLACRQDGFRLDAEEVANNLNRRLVDVDVEDLPESPDGLEAVETIALGENGVERMNPAQIDALVKWLHGGGRLLLQCGRRADLYRTTALWDAFPAKVKGHVSINRFDSLSLIFEEHIEWSGEMAVTTLEESPGASPLLWSHETPIAVDGRAGFGAIGLLLFDMDAMPIRTLARRQNILLRLVRELDQDRDRSESLALATSPDLRRRFFEDIRPVRSEIRVPLGTILPFFIAFLLLIGPLDYYILKIINRLEWTWATFALTSIVAAAAALSIIYDYKKGRLSFDRFSVVVQSPDGRCTATRTYANIHSQSNAYYDIAADRDAGFEVVNQQPGSTARIVRSGATKLTGLYVPIWTNACLVVSSIDLGVKVRVTLKGEDAIIDNLLPYALDGGMIVQEGRMLLLPGIPAERGVKVSGAAMESGFVPEAISSDPRYREIAGDVIAAARAADRRPLFIGWARRTPFELNLSDSSAAAGSVTLMIANATMEKR